MRPYLTKLLFFISPFLLVSSLYFVLDPFKVIHSYESYYVSGQPEYIVLNRGYVSTETFMRQYPQHRYNSFIFGNSRSLFWQVQDWKPWLAADASCFHFDGSDESLFTLSRKVRFLDERDVRIDNALLIVDHSVLYWADGRNGHLIATPPRLVGHSNLLPFHASFFFSYLDPRFLLAYFDFMIFGRFREYMRDHNVLNAEPMTYDAAANEIRYPQFEKAIAEGSYYSGHRKEVFSRREKNPRPYSPCLGREHVRLLKEMRHIFSTHGTDVRIVISPLYNQRPLARRDLETLRSIFGPDRIYDYSGMNDITADYRNYYELSHYRPFVAARILREIYSR